MAGKKAKDLKDGLELIAGDKGVIKSAKSAFKTTESLKKYSEMVQKVAFWQTVTRNTIKSAGGVLGCTGNVGLAKSYRPKVCGTLWKWTKATDNLAKADQSGTTADIIAETNANFPPPVGQSDFDNATDSLMKQVEQLSDGYWEAVAAEKKSSVNTFLTGSVGGTTAAGYANDYRDLTVAEAQYGKDYAAAVKVMVSVMQKQAVLAVQRRANNASRGAVEQMVNQSKCTVLEMEGQKQLLAMQITQLAMTLQDTMRLVCEALAYQMTEQYTKCLAKNDDNDIKQLCASYEGGGQLVEPFLSEPNGQRSMNVEQYLKSTLAKLKATKLAAAQLAVQKELWDKQTTSLLRINITEFNTTAATGCVRL